MGKGGYDRQNSEKLAAQVQEWERKQSKAKDPNAKPALALEHAQRGASLMKDAEANAAMQRGHEASKLGQHEEARRHFLRAHQVSGKLSARISASNALLNLGDADLAAREYEELLNADLETLSPQAHYVRTFVQEKLAEAKKVQAPASPKAVNLELWQWQQLGTQAKQSSTPLMVLAVFVLVPLLVLRARSDSAFDFLHQFII